MRIAPALALIGAAALSFSAAANATSATVTSVAVTGARYHPTSAELDSLQGSYALADGRTLRVSRTSSRLIAEVDGQKTEVVPVAPNVFASRDDGLRVQFDDAAFATDVKVSVPAR